MAWRTVNPGNMTTNNRTGANADMDESDLRSVGVDVTSKPYNLRRRNLSTVAEVSKENSSGSNNSAPLHAVAVNHHVTSAHVQRVAAGVPVVGSPRVTRHVPLDQPSPIAARYVEYKDKKFTYCMHSDNISSSLRPTGIAMLPVNPNLVNTPIEISTMNVEGYRGKNLSVPEFVADPGIYEDAPEGDKSAFEMGATNVRSLQVNFNSPLYNENVLHNQGVF